MSERYEITDDGHLTIAIRHGANTLYIDELEDEFVVGAIRQQARDLDQLHADRAAAVTRADLAERDRDILGVRVQDLKDSIADMQQLMDDGASLNVKLINERDRLRSMYVESTERLCGERDTLRARLAAIDAAPTYALTFRHPYNSKEPGQLIVRPAKD